jgi:cytochrome P450
MMSGFIFAEVDGVRLTRLEVLNMGVLLLLGGIETTTNLLGITCVTFKRQPGIFDTLRANRSKIPMFVEEVLRHDTPVQMLFRHTTTDTTLVGTAIPKGSLVLLMLGSSNRDERKFENADKFLLDRNPKEIMSFGQGPHYCLGQYLSRLEVKTAIELWLDRFEYIEPLSDDVKWLDAYFARGPKTLPVRFKAK